MASFKPQPSSSPGLGFLRAAVLGLGSAVVACSATSAWANAPSVQDLSQLSIEELANIDVSSASKASQPLSETPAALYVITHEDAVRSGATSLAEILRLAPNLQVARVTANQYAISARGFNGTTADKLLVLVDGRSVYTPFSRGVFWDAQDVPAELIERIEIISGPGATLWGANAVNGVINVVTRRAADVRGGALQAGGGDDARRVGLQYGAPLGEHWAYRVHLSGVDYDHSVTATGANARDSWRKWQGGFRLDGTQGASLITLQGDGYSGSADKPASADEDFSGYNLLARWSRPTRGNGTVQVQAYYDYLERVVPGRFKNQQTTYDLDLQHRFSLGAAHQIVWGGGYRVTKDNFLIQPEANRAQFFDPAGRTLTFGNVFAQDTVSFTPALKLTLGLKLEDDPYSGLEYLPSARLAWKASETTLLWAAASRAVRAPSRLDRDFMEVRRGSLYLTGRDFQPETVVAYEIGYRAQPTDRSSVSVSTYYNVYDDLRSFELTNGGLPIVFANRMEGETYGVELWGSYQVADWWRLGGGANWLNKDLRYEPGSSRIVPTSIAGDDPTYQMSLRSTMRLGRSVSLDVDWRNIDDLPSPVSPAYQELGARVRWAVNDTLEIVFTGSNLLHDHHPELGSASSNLQLGAIGVEAGRSFFVDTRWRF